MSVAQIVSLVWMAGFLVLVGQILLNRRARRHGGSLRSGVVGAIWDMHNKDKQKALEIIVEGKAAERRPEFPDGDLPQLEQPPREE
jgi:beta-lactamase regulating signal transducer with metallopeptidase domain